MPRIGILRRKSERVAGLQDRQKIASCLQESLDMSIMLVK